MRRRSGLALLATALIVVALAALLMGKFAAPHAAPGFAPGSTPYTSTGTSANCPSPPDNWDPLHASPAAIATYGLPPRPEGNPTAIALWADMARHAKHRICGTGQFGQSVPATPSARDLNSPAWVQFDAKTSLASAVQTIADMGLQLALSGCPGGIEALAGIPTYWSWWYPLADPARFADDRSLMVGAAPLAPHDWLHALQTAHGVVSVRIDITYSCPMITNATPVPGTPVALGQTNSSAYLRITFSSPLDNYTTALLAIASLGLRLANPCVERAIAAAGVPGAPGEESAFTAVRQLHALPGVLSVEVPYAPAC